jgi:hypothetical protein
MLTLVTLGVLILGALSILCFAACKIKAREFEFSTMICKLVSFRLTIKSPLGTNAIEHQAVGNDPTSDVIEPSAASREA